MPVFEAAPGEFRFTLISWAGEYAEGPRVRGQASGSDPTDQVASIIAAGQPQAVDITLIPCLLGALMMVEHDVHLSQRRTSFYLSLAQL